MRVFVTGATGVIGRRVVPQLVAAGVDVTAVGRTAEKRAQLERLGARSVAVDLFDRDALRHALAGHQAVVNLATHIPAPGARMLLPSAWRENDRVRRLGSAALVDAALAAGVERFVQESFAPLYEDGGEAWIDEQWPMRPVRYNRSVLDAEASAERFTRAGGIGVVLRFAAFYGPDALHVPSTLDVLRRGWMPLPGRREAFLATVSHDDAASAVVAALRAPAGRYNVVDSEPLRRGEWAALLSETLGVPPPRFLPAWTSRLGGSLMELLSRSQRMSNRKLREATGWTPRYASARESWQALVTLVTAGAASPDSPRFAGRGSALHPSRS
ncbi:NAD(P)-dependent oxidoreductase [Aggregicoccus sp. 17bor-14]|uniref:NAD-dependent epimerase/dehydratase family protein n=1 Tax=Myxococcaceae TaxID=31 RepID=UPI00129C9DC3|nr:MULTISPECIES: NAD(P)-dependent oxidoreductase [Myxococcaceae]MBF5042163.1 NAD(P)-dependent oxidoreductase [Simulacricoccus sp. 17bor-14]MRI87940.1 NAD(P)-dependent oxidoreductase [Aggregicoccus sp. 17bor-14]